MPYESNLPATGRHIPLRSAWPTAIGKPLTNRAIAKYKKLGYYATGFIKEAQDVKKKVMKSLTPKKQTKPKPDYSEFI